MLELAFTSKQLDWRWVGRYRELATYDSYWWLTWAGPFTEEEQHQWDHLSALPFNEAIRAQLGALMRRSRERELEVACAEKREPQLLYPALDSEAVRKRIVGLVQLDAEIEADEPNALVRRLYHGTLEEELDYMRLIEATYERNSARFWEYNLRINPVPTQEEMHFALGCIKHDLLEGLQRAETRQASEHLMSTLREQGGISLDLFSAEEEVDAFRTEDSTFRPNSPQK